MSDSKPKELIQAEELIKLGKTEEALELVRTFQQAAWSYFNRQESDKALEIALQCKEVFEKIGEEIDFAVNISLLGWIYNQKGDSKASLFYGTKSIELNRKLNLRQSLASSLYLVGIIHMNNNDYIQSIEFYQEALSIKEILPIHKLFILSGLGNMVAMRGEISNAIKYSEDGLKLAKELKIHAICPYFIFYLGLLNYFKGDFVKARNYLIKNIEVSKKFNVENLSGMTFMVLTIFNLEQNYLEEAKRFLNQLKKLEKKTENKIITLCYSIARGKMLIESGRTRDRAEAEALYKSVIEDDISAIQDNVSRQQHIILNLFALYFLCNLYLEELEMTNNLKILDDINPLISRLFNFAEHFKSSMLHTEVKIFQAKLELIQMNFDKAKILLTECQHLAELENLQFLAQIISNDHDRLLEQQEIWDNLKKTDAPFSERIKLASVEGILDRIQGKRSEAPIEVIDEQPVLLLILAEGGVLLFSFPFSEEWKFDDELFGGFLTAFNSISDEVFAEGIDRVKFGQNTVLMNPVEDFSICYLFKGQSYPAKQRLTKFSEQLQKNEAIWEVLKKFDKTSQVAEVNDIPDIEILLEEVFPFKK
ncbi:MAG: tetratricopeptide repeat protein [Promethearchaeota archaeon]|jgi:tetratricopeptide (TPR) repeat protein